MQDKQIYAYSWTRQLNKKIKDYFRPKNQENNTKTPKQSKNSEAPFDKPKTSNSIDVLATHKEAEKKEKTKPQKQQKETKSQSPFAKKEAREKKLTLIIGSLILLVMLSGIMIGSGVINFPTPFNTGKPIATPTGAVIATLTVTPIPTRQNSLTPTRSVPLISPPQTNCKVSGCNGEICADESLGDISSICLYQEKYTCYKNANCERQPNGKCEWTKTDSLRSCLKTT